MVHPVQIIQQHQKTADLPQKPPLYPEGAPDKVGPLPGLYPFGVALAKQLGDMVPVPPGKAAVPL